MMQDEGLTEKIIGAAFKVHNTLGAGFLEIVPTASLSVLIASGWVSPKQKDFAVAQSPCYTHQ
jgi:hypothetical protein